MRFHMEEEGGGCLENLGSARQVSRGREGIGFGQTRCREGRGDGLGQTRCRKVYLSIVKPVRRAGGGSRGERGRSGRHVAENGI